MKTKSKVKIVFWTHFLIATISHIFVVLMIGGAMSLILSASTLGFWTKGLILGATFYSGMYAVNHVTNNDGFCVLTDVENMFRKEAGMEEVGKFSPRFYKKIRGVYKWCSTKTNKRLRR